MIDIIKAVDSNKGREILVSKILKYYRELKHYNALPTQKVSISVHDRAGKLLASSRISNFNYAELKEYFEKGKGILSKYELDYSEFTIFLKEKEQEIHFDLFTREIVESIDELKRVIDLYEGLDPSNMDLIKEIASLKAEIDRLHYIIKLDNKRVADFTKDKIEDRREIRSLKEEISSLKCENRLLKQELEEISRKNIFKFLRK